MRLCSLRCLEQRRDCFLQAFQWRMVYTSFFIILEPVQTQRLQNTLRQAMNVAAYDWTNNN